MELERKLAVLADAAKYDASCASSGTVKRDGRQITFGPGARREDAPPADADERLWLTYYENIFNPARLKLSMMQKEMPRRYWKNLPEAVLITSLSAQSAARSGRMIEQGASHPARRRPAASLALRLDQRADHRLDHDPSEQPQ